MAPVHGATPTYQSVGQSSVLSDSPAPLGMAVTSSNSGGYTQQSPDALNLLALGLTPPLPHSCMWDGCGASFTSLSGLVSHVNLQHLRVTFTSPSPFASKSLSNSIALPASFPHHQPPLPRTDTDISCLWGNCDRYRSLNTIPNPSSLTSDYEVEMIILASHLLQDHLGLQTSLVSPSNPTSEAMAAEDMPLNSLSPPHSSSIPSADSPEPSADKCSVAHPCRWRSCSQTFSSCGELTAHITSVHIGAGKAQYECFWEGCKRNEEEGFSSKQKICRHLQVSNFFVSVWILHC